MALSVTLGKGWAKNGYVNFDIVHSAAKAHLDAGCTYLFQSATLNVHVAKDTKTMSGMCCCKFKSTGFDSPIRVRVRFRVLIAT